jgi:hypothetical protein
MMLASMLGRGLFLNVRAAEFQQLYIVMSTD